MADLINLWDQRDQARAAWFSFIEETKHHNPKDDPVLRALDVPVDQRSEEQRAVIDDFWERRTHLLAAVREAERRVRVASGHEAAVPHD